MGRLCTTTRRRGCPTYNDDNDNHNNRTAINHLDSASDPSAVNQLNNDPCNIGYVYDDYVDNNAEFLTIT